MSDQLLPKDVMDKIYRDIANRHKEMAKLPIEEKIRCLVEIQKMVKPIEEKRGKEIKVWEI
jgi:hypothetical protein